MILLSMSMEEKSWMILRGLRVEKRREKSTCSSLESRGRSKVTVSMSPPLDCKYVCMYVGRENVWTHIMYGAVLQT